MSVEVLNIVRAFLFLINNSSSLKKGADSMNGKAIRLIRVNNGLKLVDVAGEAGIHYSALSRIERNQYTVNSKLEQRIVRALKQLGVSEQEIELTESVVK